MAYNKGDTLQSTFDKYVIERQTGSGGSGIVYLAQNAEGPVALKVLDPAKTSSDKLKRFKNEISFCSKNAHRNIVRVLDHGITEHKEVFYVMPFFPQTLHDLMAKGIAQERVVPLFSQLLDGVEAAHLRNVFHRDVKPQNVLFDASTDSLVLADFGIARFEKEDLLTAVETRNGDRLANFLYSAPEQRVRNGAVDGRADIYALGLILNQMFTGQVPQGTEFAKIETVAPNFAYLDPLVDLMLRHDVMRRASDVAQVKVELRNRGNEFISLQRLNAAKSEVITEADIDDPIFTNPINVTDIDYIGTNLIFTLSAVPPEKWKAAFNGIRNFEGVWGKGPSVFGFQRNEALIQATDSEAPLIAGYMDDYIKKANMGYRQALIADRDTQTNQRREAVARRVADEERRQRVLSKIKRPVIS